MRGRIEVNREVLRKNFLILKRGIGRGKKVIAVVKADGYGHGGAETALSCKESDYFAVATAREGEELLAAAEETVKGKVFVLGITDEEEKAICVRKGIGFSVQGEEDVLTASRISMIEGKPARIHIALDTGMNRIGIKTETEVYKLINALKNSPCVHAESVFSHLARPGSKSFSSVQRGRFLSLSSPIAKEFPSVFRHLAASERLGDRAYAFDGARLGLALYGYGAEGVSPCMSVIGKVVRNTFVQGGESVGYDGKFTAKRDTFVATVSLGYADGLRRDLTGGSVILKGKKRRLVGNICMDCCFCLSDERVSVGDDVVFLGSCGEEKIDAEDLASVAGTIPYEILTSFRRIPRRYV